MTTEPSTTKHSYADLLKNTQPVYEPQLEDAIVINAVENINLFSYVEAIGKIIQPKNITYFSRISQNRICIYLRNKQFVDTIVTKHRFINVENNSLEARRLISSNQRVIISNVCPIIPDSLLKEALIREGINPVSSISPLRAGFHNSEYSHILSFRRQVFIPEEEKSLLPPTLKITYKNVEYRVFFALDIPFCINCKQDGHTALKCTTIIATTIQQNATTAETQVTQEANPTLKTIEHIQPDTTRQNRDTQPTTINQSPSTHNLLPKTGAVLSTNPKINEESATNNTENAEQPTTEKRPQASKRSAESSSSEINECEDVKDNEPSDIDQSGSQKTEESEKVKKRNKKARSESPSQLAAIEEIISLTKKEIENNQHQYILTFNQFRNFIENAIGSNDPIEVAREYTDDVPELVSMMKKLYPLLKHKNPKSRLTRLMTLIKGQHVDEDMDDNLQDQNILDETASQTNDPPPDM